MTMSSKTPKFLLPLSLKDEAGSSSSFSSSSSSSIDLLTSLPEPLRLQILSLLPFRSAVQTSVLSSHWRHLYKKRAVNLILSLSQTLSPSDIETSIAGGDLPLDSLHLIARCRHINDRLPHWLSLASGRRVRDLTVDLPGLPELSLLATAVPFPSLAFPSLSSLVRLTLGGVRIELGSPFVNLPSLEVLNLYRLWIGDRDLNTIVKGCGALRTLEVRRCSGLQRLVFERSLLSDSKLAINSIIESKILTPKNNSKLFDSIY